MSRFSARTKAVSTVLLVLAAGCSVGDGSAVPSTDSAVPSTDSAVPSTLRNTGLRPVPYDFETGVGRASPPDGLFVDVSASSLRTCGVRAGGEIVCWGEVFASREMIPEGVFSRVSLSERRACGIRADGSIVCWSRSPESDRVGLEFEQHEGRFVDVWSPALVKFERYGDELGGAYYVDSSWSSLGCGVRDDGELVCTLDGPLSGLPEGRFSRLVRTGSWWPLCALSVDGEVVCWGGHGGYGRYRLPQGRFVDMDVFDDLVEFDDRLEFDHRLESYRVSAGCAVRVEGPVVCWPWQDLVRWSESIGAVGERDGEFVQVRVHGESVCALTADGDIECWGDGALAEHGSARGPFVQFDMSDVMLCAVSAPGPSGSPGGLSCWGVVPESDMATWVKPPGEWIEWFRERGSFSQVSVDGDFACGVTAVGAIECWTPESVPGDRYSWTESWPTESELPDESVFVSVRLGLDSACAVRVDTTVWCRKWNDAARAAAAEGGFAQAWPARGGFCGLRTDGEVYCAAAGLVEGIGGRRMAKFFPGDLNDCGLGADGRIECWGVSGVGAPPEGVGPLVSAAAADDRMCGVRAEGSLVCWVADERGFAELVDAEEYFAGLARPGAGNGSLGPLVEVVAGESLGSFGWCVLSSAGEVACWWGNDDDLRAEWRLEAPTEAPPPGRFTDVAMGRRHACAIRDDGTMACWGDDSDLLTAYTWEPDF